MLSKVKTHWFPICKAILIAMGALWLPIEAYEVLTNQDAKLPFSCFLALSVVVGITFFLADGFSLSGFLKNEINITSNGFDTKISVKFGNLFSQEGWKAISVNDFFDSIVDDDLVSINSLHGQVITTYWPDDRNDWQSQINSSLSNVSIEKENRAKGNKKRYPIGTTGIATTDNQKMLFVALGRTDTDNNVTSATAESLICAVRGLLKKARASCANEPLFIPLMGSGLGRVGIKNNILVDLILAAIYEETMQSKVTEKITIILPKEKAEEINLGNFIKDWN